MTMMEVEHRDDLSVGPLVFQNQETTHLPPCDPKTQAEVVCEIERRNFPPLSGGAQHLISARWWNDWAAFTGFTPDSQADGGKDSLEAAQREVPKPGPIDNTDILLSDLKELKPNLREGEDYVLRCPETWNKLEGWYGGGPSIAREAYLSKSSGSKPVVDIYPYKFTVLTSSRGEVVSISKHATVADLKTKACNVFGADERDMVFADYLHLNVNRYLDDDDSKTVEEIGLIDNQDLLLELKATPGQTGLSNLGNTCYMNSSLQCLGHTLPFIRYYLSGKFQEEINRSNPLGFKGELAKAFADLMSDLWQGKQTVSPSTFKSVLSTFSKTFEGYQQHDSQELLAFLLDGLHEDQNRVINKPLLPDVEAGGRPDKELADEAWANHKRRNDSFVVDHCQGLYKSTVVCPQCSNSSTKFEVFMHLALPLPLSDERTLNITVVAVDGSKLPTMYSVSVRKTGTVGDLYKALAKALGLPVDAADQVLVIVNTENGKITEQLENLGERIRERFSPMGSLVAYVYPSPEAGPHAGLSTVLVFHRRSQKRHHWSSLFAAPLMLFMDAEKVEDAERSSVQEPCPFSSGTHFVVSRDSEISHAIESALRPFKRIKRAKLSEEASLIQPSLPELKAAGSSDSDAEATTMVVDHPSPAGGWSVWIRNGLGGADGIRAEDAGWSDSAAAPPQPGTPPYGSSTQEPPAPWPMSPLDTPPVSLNTSPVQSREPSPKKQEADGSGLALRQYEPFNMWAAQTGAPSGVADMECSGGEQATSAGEDCAMGTETTEPYTVLRCDELGNPANPCRSEGEPACFAINWHEHGGDAFEFERLERPEFDDSARAAQQRAAQPVSHTLQECIDAFLKPERLDVDEKWYCSQCKAHVQADKKLDLWSFPEVLVVQLKRFAYGRTLSDKLTARVDFPLRGLVLESPGDRAVYDLYGVSNHTGGLASGHYTACCRNPGSQQWFMYNDSRVTAMPEEDVVSDAAYLLFYRRCDAAENDAEELETLLQNAEKVRQQLEAASPEREQAIQPTSPVALNGSGIDGYRATFGPAHRPAKPRSVSSEGSDGGNAENGHPNEREGMALENGALEGSTIPALRPFDRSGGSEPSHCSMAEAHTDPDDGSVPDIDEDEFMRGMTGEMTGVVDRDVDSDLSSTGAADGAPEERDPTLYASGTAPLRYIYPRDDGADGIESEANLKDRLCEETDEDP